MARPRGRRVRDPAPPGAVADRGTLRGPITGTGAAGARVASMLVGVLAIVAIYALGRRVAGLVGAGAAVTLALICDPFRDSLSSGNSVAVLVLASCIFLLAMHRVLVKG